MEPLPPGEPLRIRLPDGRERLYLVTEVLGSNTYRLLPDPEDEDG